VVIHLEASHTERDQNPVYVSWFSSELCLSVTMLSCSAEFVTRKKAKQYINFKCLV
jgi:hypothetical protein